MGVCFSMAIQDYEDRRTLRSIQRNVDTAIKEIQIIEKTCHAKQEKAQASPC
jgi:hypothetical protein